MHGGFRNDEVVAHMSCYPDVVGGKMTYDGNNATGNPFISLPCGGSPSLVLMASGQVNECLSMFTYTMQCTSTKKDFKKKWSLIPLDHMQKENPSSMYHNCVAAQILFR
jgi:hypothetical protein